MFMHMCDYVEIQIPESRPPNPKAEALMLDLRHKEARNYEPKHVKLQTLFAA